MLLFTMGRIKEIDLWLPLNNHRYTDLREVATFGQPTSLKRRINIRVFGGLYMVWDRIYGHVSIKYMIEILNGVQEAESSNLSTQTIKTEGLPLGFSLSAQVLSCSILHKHHARLFASFVHTDEVSQDNARQGTIWVIRPQVQNGHQFSGKKQSVFSAFSA